MPSTIHKPALKTLTDGLLARHQQDPSFKIDAKTLDQIVSIIGDHQGADSASIADQLKSGQLSPQEKLALAKNGLSDQETKDVKTHHCGRNERPTVQGVSGPEPGRRR